jgi:diguanylate cyclase
MDQKNSAPQKNNRDQQGSWWFSTQGIVAILFITVIGFYLFTEHTAHFLEIEVTETSMTSSLSTIARTLNQLREIGLKIAIDDFGTGQASQQYLLELPIDVIKIDKVFVQSINHNPAAAAIVKNAILLAHDLKVKVIAEGIETRKQYDLLKKWGCDGGQGYLIGQSMKGIDATQWLKEKLSKK